ncbi:kinase-like domain-containing protein [Crucibulum laeve]|uniref:Kinase-like domain-containing protein n=1 Tax=Crucibulum laeve TaxID=68775 RepID=A0A5C3M3C8_9AGAR|nr:kinase-like domain-containing protein [Crucibulum laeve]
MVLERIQGYVRATGQSNEEGADAILETFLPVLHWTFREQNKICLILDHYPNGTLHDLVKREGSLTAAKTLRLVTELTTALTVFSSLSIVHGSIYPSGIMIDMKGHVVLSDFGDAKFLDFEYCYPDGSMHGKDEEGAWREKKTYLAPEILLGWMYSQAADVWGLGMVMYFMLFGKHPFIVNAQNEEKHDSIALDSTIIYDPIPTDWLHLIHPVAKDLMLKCLERNPSLRLDIIAVRRHAYFAHV